LPAKLSLQEHRRNAALFFCAFSGMKRAEIRLSAYAFNRRQKQEFMHENTHEKGLWNLLTASVHALQGTS
jgi:hypothetical protein